MMTSTTQTQTELRTRMNAKKTTGIMTALLVATAAIVAVCNADLKIGETHEVIAKITFVFLATFVAVFGLNYTAFLTALLIGKPAVTPFDPILEPAPTNKTVWIQRKIKKRKLNPKELYFDYSEHGDQAILKIHDMEWRYTIEPYRHLSGYLLHVLDRLPRMGM